MSQSTATAEDSLAPVNQGQPGRENTRKAGGRKKGDATFEKLYQAAMEEFRRVGFVESQIEAIAKAGNTSRATFYFHFPSKDDVLVEAQRRRSQKLIELISERLDTVSVLSVKNFLEITFDGVVMLAEQEEDPKLLKELLALQIRRTSHHQADIVQSESAKDSSIKDGGIKDSGINDKPFAKLAAQFFKQAIQNGQVRDDLTAADITKAYLNCMFDLLREVAENPAGYKDSCKNMIKIFVSGVSP